MKMTLLEMVQDILNAMDSDEVNTITETVESDQVAQIIKSTYFELISRRSWAHLKQLFYLEASTTAARPTHMRVPEEIAEVTLITYNTEKVGQTRKQYSTMKYITPEAFLMKSNSLNSDNANVTVVTDATGVEVLIRNDTAPTCYTSFDDEYLVFDAYDSSEDSSWLVASKTQCWGIRQPTWTNSDTFVPDLPADAFALLLAESKEASQFQVRQFNDAVASKQAQRQRFRMSQKNWVVNKQNRYPNYGRNGRGRSGTPPKDGDN